MFNVYIFRKPYIALLFVLTACSNPFRSYSAPRQVQGFGFGILTKSSYRSLGTGPCATRVKLMWNANPESDLAGYTLRIRTDGMTNPHVIAVGNTTQTTIMLDPGTYNLTITASNTRGNESDESAVLSHTAPNCPQPPPAGNEIVASDSVKDLTALTFSTKFKSDPSLCDGQRLRLQKSPDLITWTDVEDDVGFIAIPIDRTITVPILASEPRMFWRFKHLQNADGTYGWKFKPNCPPADEASASVDEYGYLANEDTVSFTGTLAANSSFPLSVSSGETGSTPRWNYGSDVGDMIKITGTCTGTSNITASCGCETVSCSNNSFTAYCQADIASVCDGSTVIKFTGASGASATYDTKDAVKIIDNYVYGPANGDSLAAYENAMSADGNKSVFSSKATAYSSYDPKGANSDIFLKNLLTGRVTRVSANSNSALEAACVGTCVSEDGRISANGRFVAFSTSRTDLGAYPTNDTMFVAVDKYRSLILHDTQNKTNKIVSIDTDGIAPLIGRNGNASVSDDGRWVVFMNTTDNYRIYIKDMLDDEIGPAGSGGPLLRIGSNNNDRQPKMDRNGNFVVFASGFHNSGGSLYLWRRSDKRTQLLSQDGGFFSYGIASTGAFVDHAVSSSYAPKKIRLTRLLDSTTSPNTSIGPALREVSEANSPGGVWTSIGFSALTMTFSDDGTKAIYRGTNSTQWLGHYLFDLVNNTHTALPLLPAEYQASVQNPMMSANGKKAVFISRPDTAGHSSGWQIFMYDLESATTSAVTGESIAPPPPNEDVEVTAGYYGSMDINPDTNYKLTYSGESSEMIFRVNGENAIQTWITSNQLVLMSMGSGWNCDYSGTACQGPNGENITFDNFDPSTLKTTVRYSQ